MITKTSAKKKRRTIAPHENTNAATATANFGVDLIEGPEQVLEHQRGKIQLKQVWPKPVDVKAVPMPL